ncbi:hypothetical protein C8R43DRAFT_1109510 [Mycena crocata]|nr:hypothetical protein C8R43DRAFT_1109510 [Mycena crocata]
MAEAHTYPRLLLVPWNRRADAGAEPTVLALEMCIKLYLSYYMIKFNMDFWYAILESVQRYFYILTLNFDSNASSGSSVKRLKPVRSLDAETAHVQLLCNISNQAVCTINRRSIRTAFRNEPVIKKVLGDCLSSADERQWFMLTIAGGRSSSFGEEYENNKTMGKYDTCAMPPSTSWVADMPITKGPQSGMTTNRIKSPHNDEP